MKKTLLLSLAIAASIASSALAQTPSGTTFSFTPTTQNVALGGNFNVTISLSGTTPPANITAYDLYLVTAAANSGFFRITSSTPTGPFNASGPTIPPSGDPFSTAAASGFVRNGLNLGYSGPPQNPPYSISLQSINIALNPGVPLGTHTFFTSTVANANGFFSDVSDTNGGVFTVGQGSFQIAVVPEPSTWSLVGLGGLACIGMTVLRRRRCA